MENFDRVVLAVLKDEQKNTSPKKFTVNTFTIGSSTAYGITERVSTALEVSIQHNSLLKHGASYTACLQMAGKKEP